jgi:hypothetical protein
LPRRPSSGAAAQVAALRRQSIVQQITHVRAEAQAVREGVAETLALGQARGEAFHHPPSGRGERAKPVVRLDGLAWLASKGRLTPRQVQAGNRYGRLAQLVEGGEVASSMALMEIRSTGRAAGPTEAKVWARAKLKEAREALGEHRELVFALDQVCALGKRPREVIQDQRASERLEDRLGIGLDLLVRAWGL